MPARLATSLRGRRQELQQTARAGARHGADVELALLPGNRIGQRLAGAGNVGAVGDGAHRMRQRADVDAAAGRDLADLQRQEMVAALFGHLGQQRQFAGAGELGGKVPVERVGQRRIARRLQTRDGVDRLAPREIRAVGVRRMRIGDVDASCGRASGPPAGRRRSCRRPRRAW